MPPVKAGGRMPRDLGGARTVRCGAPLAAGKGGGYQMLSEINYGKLERIIIWMNSAKPKADLTVVHQRFQTFYQKQNEPY